MSRCYLKLCFDLESKTAEIYRYLQRAEFVCERSKSIFSILEKEKKLRVKKLLLAANLMTASKHNFKWTAQDSHAATLQTTAEIIEEMKEQHLSDLDVLHLAKRLEMHHWNFYLLKSLDSLHGGLKDLTREMIQESRFHITLLGNSFIGRL